MSGPSPFKFVRRLLRLGLVVAEHERERKFMIYRPIGLGGTVFPRRSAGMNYSLRGDVFLTADAPSASLHAVETAHETRWVVDISEVAAPGPGPVWFHEEFGAVEDAVEAIRDCYFGNRIDFQSASLVKWGYTAVTEESPSCDGSSRSEAF
jgi:hypothetical protein